MEAELLLVSILIFFALLFIGVGVWSIERRSAAAARRAKELAKTDSELRRLELLLVFLLEMQALFLGQLGPSFPKAPNSAGAVERRRLQRALSAQLAAVDPYRNKMPNAIALAESKDVLKWREEDLERSIAQVLFLLREVAERR
ncbi:MAG: hypothetical protein WB801_06290 [Candidatus Dormiibacterota bacterium]